MRLLLATLAATAYAQNAKLVIVAQFKNEAESLPQWLDHYFTDEGVSTMLLIDEKKPCSSCSAILRIRILRLDGRKRPYRCGERYTLER